MGGLMFKAVAKTGKDKIQTSYKSLFDIPTVDIDENPASLAKIC